MQLHACPPDIPALLWFVAGFSGGVALMLIKVGSPAELRHAYVTGHAHVLLVGFLTNMVMGVAFWMFPRPQTGA